VRAQDANQRAFTLRDQAAQAVSGSEKKASDADYVFITFILNYLPHGVIGLLVTVFFAAALQSKSAELNALASTTTVDLYRHVIRKNASDRHYFLASKVFTAMWGVIAVGFAMFIHLKENLVQAANIVASIFYGVALGIFLVGFFFKRAGGTAVFVSSIFAQVLVIMLYMWGLPISYLWYNVIGAIPCVGVGAFCQFFLPDRAKPDLKKPATS